MVKKIIISSLFTFSISLLTHIFLARAFNVSFIADVKSVILYSSWFNVVSSFQVHSSYLYFHKNVVNRSNYRLFSLGYIFIAGLVSSIIFFFSFDIFYTSQSINKLGLIFFSLITIFNLFYLISPAIYLAEDIYNKLPVFLIFNSIANLLALIITKLLQVSINFYAFFLFIFLFIVFLSSDWLRFLIYFLKHIKRFRNSMSIDLLKYSKNISISMIIESFANRLDKFLISFFYSNQIFGKYSILSFENPINNIVLNSFGLSIVKKISCSEINWKAKFIKDWEVVVSFITFINFPITLLIIQNYRVIITLLFGELYLSSSLVFLLYIATSFIRPAPYQALLRMHGDVKYNIVISSLYLIASILTLGTVFLLKLSWEYLGLSVMAGWLAYNVSAAFIFSKNSGIELTTVLGIRIIVFRLLQIATSIVLASIIQNNIFINTVIFSLTYLMIVFVTDSVIRDLIVSNVKKFLKSKR